jgi:hypothetical protein
LKSRFRGPCPSEIPGPLWERLLLLINNKKKGPVTFQSLSEIAGEHLQELGKSKNVAKEEAFDLLAVDALVTYACEFATEEEDMEVALSKIFDALKVGKDSNR